MELLEISDLVLAYDGTARRVPVLRDAVVGLLREQGDRRGARIVSRMPADAAGYLLPEQVDAVLLRSHLQLQRLSEELQLGQRALEVLQPLVAVLRPGLQRPVRVVDVGCGLGHVVRWLACNGGLGDTTLTGCDLNAPLLEEARRLAAAERLRCDFLTADALSLPVAPDVFISTGFVHHLRGSELPAVMSAQSAASAVVHWDIAPGPLTGLGARVFHLARMREPLARHDGVVSALRAHDDATLVAAVLEGLPGHVPLVIDPSPGRNPLVAVLRPVLAVRPELVDPFLTQCSPSLRRRVQVHR